MPIHTLTIQKLRIRVKDHGHGPPVLLMHGNPDSSEMWTQVIDALPQGYRCLMPDLPGFGESGVAAGFDWSVKNRGQWIADILDKLKITEPVILVGHDHGGPFVASFAVQYPERVKKLVLQNTLFHADYDWHLFGKLWRLPLIGDYMAFWQPYLITLPIALWYMKRSSPLLTTAYIASLQKTWTYRMGRAMLALYRASNPQEFIGWQEKLEAFIATHPTLVLWGERDCYLPLRFAENWEKNGATVIRFPEAGHWLAIEKPVEYAHHLANFFIEQQNIEAIS